MDKEKEEFDKIIASKNVELKTFNFLDKDFDEKFSNYKDWLRHCFYNKENKQIEKGRTFWTHNVYSDDLIEYYEMIQHQYPQFLKDFLSAFVKTRFFAKYYKEYKEAYPDYADYCLANWWVSGSRHNSEFDNINNIFVNSVEFGEIPRYEGDKYCAIILNFKTKEAKVARGWAVGAWASKVLKKYSPVPKYMKPIVDKLFNDFDTWAKENNYKGE